MGVKLLECMGWGIISRMNGTMGVGVSLLECMGAEVSHLEFMGVGVSLLECMGWW